MKTIEILEIIDKINGQIPTIIFNNHPYLVLEYKNIYGYEAIFWAGICLWNNENDEREWIIEKHDYEDFEQFLHNQMKKYSKILDSISLAIFSNSKT